MAIEVTGKVAPQDYEIVCTDKECRAILRFNQDDVTWVTRSSMGRDVGRVRGISCPLCRQVLPLKDAREVTPTPD